jgi:hypothetical protein
VAAEKLGGGRVNFLSYCMDRLFKAVDAIANREALGPDGFVAGFGAFLPVIPASAVGITDEIAELWDPAVRHRLLERYADLLKTLHGRETAADALLTDDADRVSLAISLESIGASEARRAELEEKYVTLCAFPSVAASIQVKDADTDTDTVRACEVARLKWLGYTDVPLPEGQRLTIGAGMVRSVADESGVLTAVMMIGGFLPMEGVLVAALFATGGRLDTLGWIGAAFVGMSGVAVGFPIYLKLSARAKYGSVQRKLALAISILVIVAVAAACGYLYIRFLTR